jgi:hypothetical protein
MRHISTSTSDFIRNGMDDVEQTKEEQENIVSSIKMQIRGVEYGYVPVA